MSFHAQNIEEHKAIVLSPTIYDRQHLQNKSSFTPHIRVPAADALRSLLLTASPSNPTTNDLRLLSTRRFHSFIHSLKWAHSCNITVDATASCIIYWVSIVAVAKQVTLVIRRSLPHLPSRRLVRHIIIWNWMAYHLVAPRLRIKPQDRENPSIIAFGRTNRLSTRSKGQVTICDWVKIAIRIISRFPQKMICFRVVNRNTILMGRLTNSDHSLFSVIDFI